MYLEEILSWIKTISPSFTTYIAGVSLKNQTDALGVYVLAQNEAMKKNTIGGLSQNSYKESSVRLSVQMNEPCAAQKKAMTLYRELEKESIRMIANHKIQMVKLHHQEPQPQKDDECGQTYNIDLLITYER